MQRNQSRLAALKALEEDPTIFLYDEVYDEMQQIKEEQKPVKVDKKVSCVICLLHLLLHQMKSFVILFIQLAQVCERTDKVSRTEKN